MNANPEVTKNALLHLAFLSLSLIASTSFAQSAAQRADSALQQMTLRQKIGQLFMVKLPSDTSHVFDMLPRLFRQYTPGGVCFSRGGAMGVARQIVRLQAAAPMPLLVGVDAGYSLGQALDSVATLSEPLLFHAQQDQALTYALGLDMGRQMNVLGIHINTLLDMDTLVMRSASRAQSRKVQHIISPCATAFLRGLHDRGVWVAVKETPLFFSRNRTYTGNFAAQALRVFESLAKGKVDGFLLSTDGAQHSRGALADFSLGVSSIRRLRSKRVFRGFSFVSWRATSYESTLSLHAVRYLLEVGGVWLDRPAELASSIQNMEVAIGKNRKLINALDRAVQRILIYKEQVCNWHGSIAAMMDSLHTADTYALNNQLAENALTIASNPRDLIPIQSIDGKTFAVLSIGHGAAAPFERYLAKFAPIDCNAMQTPADTVLLTQAVHRFDVVIVALYAMEPELRHAMLEALNRLKSDKIILCSFANPQDLEQLAYTSTLMLGYTDAHPLPMHAAQAIFGAILAAGRLPLSINAQLTRGQSHPNATLDRLGYGLPEEVGMDSHALTGIDSIVQAAIDSAAMPGCSIVIARRGKVVFEKAYGRLTYERDEPVTEHTLYDLASITKAAATLQVIAALYDSEAIDIYKKASAYLPEMKGTDKADVTIKDILTHQAGLVAFVPFWKKTIADSVAWSAYYSRASAAPYTLQVAPHIFAAPALRDSVWLWTLRTPLLRPYRYSLHRYVYSDMGFYILHRLAQAQLHRPMEDFLNENFYQPMGASTLGYLPLNSFSSQQIAPTAIDKLFRNDTIVGWVNDPIAAMQGGVAGHAGLFGNANDLAKIGQLWLQQGCYGGARYLSVATVRQFTARQYASNRRGLGWDKIDSNKPGGPASRYASNQSFGHTGFTGTMMWVDPVFDLVYVFLSNRTYPDEGNMKLVDMNVRTRIQDAIYRSIFDCCMRGDSSRFLIPYSPKPLR